ncbi:CKLF-like MARVEL transmembrane domain-containing protein 6 [Pseudophryne corroboree]|uniref:CKLF-like MARVEL transmembrane domain-containing protein 6 n=1 Tax=Pseudophryne corroboree TaxID=495146 RepID=UPI0030820EDD
MADGTPAAYGPTTEPNPKKASWYSGIQLPRLHLALKVSQLLLSFVAFICEEVISTCNSCGGLYFFEFVSCSAVLLSILMLVIYCSPLRQKISIPSFKKIDFWITLCVGVLFFIASISFVATMESNALVTTSVIFGVLAAFAFLIELYFMWKGGYIKQNGENGANGEPVRPENEPLRIPIQVDGTDTA